MNTQKIVGLALLTAIVAVLQVIAPAIRPAGGIFSISLVLVPIVIGAAIYGWKAGAWLGLVFSVIVLINDSTAFYAINPLGTIITVIVKGVTCGVIAGIVYDALNEKSTLVAAIAAAIICPIVNSGIFFLGCELFFLDGIKVWSTGAGYPDAGKYILFVIIGVNFFIEMAVNIVLSSVIVKIIKAKATIEA